MMIRGNLNISWENTEGILWCIDDDEKRYILKTGDHLKIFDGDTEIWCGELEFHHVNEKICGMFVTEIPQNVDHKQWFGWFYTSCKALLIRKEI